MIVSARPKGLKIAILLGLLSVYSGSAFSAYQEEKPDLWNLDMDELLAVKVKVASKSEETALDAPSSVTVFTRTELMNMGITNLEELLNFVPGYQTNRQVDSGVRWLVGTRGVNLIESPSVLLLINGFRVNEHHTGGFTLLDRMISLGDVERIEIIRGPGSALYGSNAYLGVINVVTTKDSHELDAAVGNHESRDFNVNLAHSRGDFEISAYIRAYSDDGFLYENLKDGLGVVDTSRDPISGEDFRVAIRYKEWFVTFNRRERRTQDFYQFGTLGDHINHSDTRTNGIFAGREFQINPKHRGEVRLGYMFHEWTSLHREALQDDEIFTEGDFLLGPVLEHRLATLSADFSVEFSENNTLNYGAAIEFSEIPEAFNVGNYDFVDGSYLGDVVEQPGEDRRFMDEVSREIRGVYVQDKAEFGEAWDFIAGIRIDDYDDFGTSINPRAALIYSGIPKSKVKLMFGEAFLAPSLAQLYLKNNPQTAGNPNLEPQEIQTWELAYGYQTTHSQATLTYFHNSESSIINLFKEEGELGIYLNLGEREVEGLELEWAASLGPKILVRGMVSHLTDGRTPSFGKTSAALILNFNFGDWNLNLNGYGRTDVSHFGADSSWYRVNSMLRYRIGESATCYLRIGNLFDERVKAPDLAGVTRQPYIPERGSLYWLGLTYKMR